MAKEIETNEEKYIRTGLQGVSSYSGMIGGRRVGKGGAQIGSCRLEGCRPIPPGGRGWGGVEGELRLQACPEPPPEWSWHSMGKLV